MCFCCYMPSNPCRTFSPSSWLWQLLCHNLCGVLRNLCSLLYYPGSVSNRLVDVLCRIPYLHRSVAGGDRCFARSISYLLYSTAFPKGFHAIPCGGSCLADI